MSDLVAVLLVGVGTYLSRASFILALANRAIPPRIVQALQYVAPAVLAALIFALLTTDEGTVAIGLPELSAFLAGGAVAYKTRNHLYTLIAGMAVFWIVRAIV